MWKWIGLDFATIFALNHRKDVLMEELKKNHKLWNLKGEYRIKNETNMQRHQEKVKTIASNHEKLRTEQKWNKQPKATRESKNNEWKHDPRTILRGAETNEIEKEQVIDSHPMGLPDLMIIRQGI
jgi:hypothetical protein